MNSRSNCLYLTQRNHKKNITMFLASVWRKALAKLWPSSGKQSKAKNSFVYFLTSFKY